MAAVATQAPVDVPSSNRPEPGSFQLNIAEFPSAAAPPSKPEDADAVAGQWVESFNKAVGSADPASISSLFHAQSYWRDQLCLSWDFHTLQGPEKIVSLFKQGNGCRIKSVALDKSSQLRSPTAAAMDAEGKVHSVTAFLTVESDIGRGAGIVRLAQDGGAWKVFTLFTFLKELKNHEEAVGRKRPNGVAHGEHISRKNWLDRRGEEQNFENGEDPTVLILGKYPSLYLWKNELIFRRCWTSWTHRRCET